MAADLYLRDIDRLAAEAKVRASRVADDAKTTAKAVERDVKTNVKPAGPTNPKK